MSYKLLIENRLRGLRQSAIMRVRSLRHLPAMPLSGATAKRDWFSIKAHGL